MRNSLFFLALEDTVFVGRGIGFSRDEGLVAAIVIFEPGMPPN